MHPIYCDISCPAERVRYMACRLTSDISKKDVHHYWTGSPPDLKSQTGLISFCSSCSTFSKPIIHYYLQVSVINWLVQKCNWHATHVGAFKFSLDFSFYISKQNYQILCIFVYYVCKIIWQKYRGEKKMERGISNKYSGSHCNIWSNSRT